MKKAILILFIVGILATTIASADSMTTNVAPPKPTMMANESKLHPTWTSVKLTGLYNAEVAVRNNDTRNHIEAVWSNIQDREKLKLSNLTDITIEKSGVTEDIRGFKEAKFLGLFKANKEYWFELRADGSIVRMPKFWDFLWKMG